MVEEGLLISVLASSGALTYISSELRQAEVLEIQGQLKTRPEVTFKILLYVHRVTRQGDRFSLYIWKQFNCWIGW
jgi:hypothetical protein